MSIGAIGAVLAVLVIIFIIGHIWYAIVEGGLSGIRKLIRKLSGNRDTGAWHTLPPGHKKEEDNHD